jgi:hypothetical protein
MIILEMFWKVQKNRRKQVANTIAKYIGTEGIEVSIEQESESGTMEIPFFDSFPLLFYQYERLKMNREVAEIH